MKKTVLLTFLISFLFSVLNAQDMQFARTRHDFGTIRESDGDVSNTFTFTNTGKSPLVIKNVEASCGCTSPEWTKEPVLSGKKGAIKATFNPLGRVGHFEKKLTVTTSQGTAELYIAGVVEAKVLTLEEQYPLAVDRLRLKSEILELYRVASTASKTEQLEIINTGATPLVVNFENVPAHISVVSEPVSIPAGSKGIIKCTYNAAKRNAFGLTVDEITLRVKDSKNILKIRANIEEDFSKLTAAELEKAPVFKSDNTNIQFNSLKKGSRFTGTSEIRNEGKTDLTIRKISSDCDCIRASIDTQVVKPGKTATLKLELTAVETGSKLYSVTVVSNAPKQREKIFYMSGTVE